MNQYEGIYQRVRERMSLDDISISEVRERVQLALALALSTMRADGAISTVWLHAQFAADATAWVGRQLDATASFVEKMDRLADTLPPEVNL